MILADQGPGDVVGESVAYLLSHGIACEHLRFRPQGRAFALNRGLERVRTPFLAITDDDCLVRPDWLEAITTQLTQNPRAIVTGPVEQAGAEPAVAIRTSRALIIQRRPRLLRSELLAGGNMGASLNVIEQIGPFDEDSRLFAAEDREWAYRALRIGVTIVYSPRVVVGHIGWRTRPDRAAQYRAYGRSQGAFYGRSARRGDGLLAARYFLHLGYAAGKSALGLLLRRPEQRLAGAAFFAGMVLGVVAGLRADSEVRMESTDSAIATTTDRSPNRGSTLA